MSDKHGAVAGLEQVIVGYQDTDRAIALARKAYSGDGSALLMIEAIALRIQRVRGARPFGVGSAIPDVAPARAAKEPYQPRETVVTAAGNRVVRNSGYRGQSGLRPVTALQRMEDQSARAYRGDRADRVPLFTTGQIMVAEDYAALFERCQSAGVKCSSIEGLGAGGQGSFIDAVMADSSCLARMQLAVGDHIAMGPRSSTSVGRNIRIIDLVNLVCVAEKTCDDVLRHYNWSTNQRHRRVLLVQLCGALDRMRGFGSG